jgi:esterase/lipase
MRRMAAAFLAMALWACGTEPTIAPSGRAVSFSTSDGVELEGELHGGGDLAVILLHMFPADRTSWRAFAQQLAAEGHAALSFDFRGFGSSGGERRVDLVWRDALAAVRFMMARGHDRVALVGASMGGTAALIVAAREDLAAVVTLSAPSTFRGLAIPPEALELIDEPKLFIAAQGDVGAASSAQQLYAESPGTKELQILEGSDHGTELLEGGQGGAVRTAIVEFLQAQAA